MALLTLDPHSRHIMVTNSGSCEEYVEIYEGGRASDTTGTYKCDDTHAKGKRDLINGIIIGLLTAMVIGYTWHSTRTRFTRTSTTPREDVVSAGAALARLGAPLAGYTPYSCGKAGNVFCCREVEGNGTTANKKSRSTSRWYTRNCESYEDGYTCCYFDG